MSEFATGSVLRTACRNGKWDKPTPGLAPGFVQANLVIMPQRHAFDFLLFCLRNKQACPLLEVTDTGSFEPKDSAPGADLRTDLPRYAVYEQGQLVDQPVSVLDRWKPDAVCFLIGCSFTFEHALLKAGVPVRHIEQRVNVPMFRTNRPNRRAGIFHGELVVSMRPMLPEFIETACKVTASLPLAHGAPIQIGEPEVLGIRDLQKPDFGDPVEIRPGEIPVFWACGVTPQAAIMEARPEWAITHLPGHMFVTDLREEDLLSLERNGSRGFALR